MLNLLYAIILPIMVHELGHFCVALLFGKVIKFNFSFGKLFGVPVPRWTWLMPHGLTLTQTKLIAQSGFALELALVPFLPVVYSVVAIIHFIAYPWYAGSSTDFKFMY